MNTSGKSSGGATLLESRWRQLTARDCETTAKLAQALITLGSAAETEGAFAEAKSLRLLAALCEMGLQTDGGQGPFQPSLVFRGRRSLLPDDLTEEEIAHIAALAEHGEVPARLRARLADVVWTRLQPRDPRFARMAIDAYSELPITPQAIFHGGREELLRAIDLCRELGRDCMQRLTRIEEVVLSAFFSATDHAGFREELAGLLLGGGLARSKSLEVAKLLEETACSTENNGNFPGARELFLTAAAWFKRAQDEESWARSTSAAAEMWKREGEFYRRSEDGGYIMAGSAYEAGIHLLRSIPRRLRSMFDVASRIAELRRGVAESHERALDAMESFSTEPTDLTRFVENARAQVAGKGPWEGLCAFVQLVPHPPPSHWHEQARSAIAESPLQMLFGTSRFSKDGRLVSRSAGLDLGDPGSPAMQEAVHERAIQNLVMFQSLVVHGGILPALDVLNLEQRPTEKDFVSLAHRSPIVPYGRERIFGRGLCAGFRRDFVVAVHLLAPQLEHVVRTHVAALGGTTRHFDVNGIETELGLSSLMELPEAAKAFGETLAFELGAIFTDRAGSNLRNELAHGLLDDADAVSTALVYAWWFCLRLVMLPLLPRRPVTMTDEPSPKEDLDDAEAVTSTSLGDS